MGQELGVQGLSKQQCAAIDRVQTSINQCLMFIGHAHMLWWLTGMLKPIHICMNMLRLFLFCEAYVSQRIACLRRCLMLFDWLGDTRSLLLVTMSCFGRDMCLVCFSNTVYVPCEDAFDDVKQCQSHVTKQDYAHLR